MLLFRKKIILTIAVALLFAGCADEQMEQYANVPISIGVTRAGESEIKTPYNLLLWTGEKEMIPSSLFYGFIGKEDFGGPFPLTENGVNPLYYPYRDIPVRGVGYLPSDMLVASDGYNTLMVNKDLLPVGFFDVCSTTVIEGRASSPFDNAEKRFDFKHTLVKLDFTAVKTVNVNARVSRIYITLKGTGIRDKWVYDPTVGYKPTLSTTTPYKDLVFSSGTTPDDEDFDIQYPNTGGINEWAEGKELFFFGHPEGTNQITEIKTSERLKTCYIAHDASDTFIFKDGQAYIRLYNMKARLTKQGIAGAVDIENLPQTIDIPLTDMNGNPWTKEVKAGDAFNIYIVFDQNKIRLYGQKKPWSLGGRLYVPLDPRNGTVVTTGT